GLVDSPKRWAWSSHRHYAYGEPDDLITDAPEYLALGHNGAQRRRAYLHLFARELVGPYLNRRPDLVDLPFVGDPAWVAAQLVLSGLAPPS
ncbi:MAG TPA: transposase, partial [Anaeromyxobacteraceae bacterium]|nr:transposase [Anaeromyxobacteraceae bacterium]